MTRALVFDLDDTLYLERRFALSGYAAVANHLASAHGLNRRDVFGFLRRELGAGRRADVFQRLVMRFGLPLAIVEELLAVYRDHAPSLRLPATTRRVLGAARESWRVGILTNGPPALQRRKVAALGLASLVDAVIFAHEVGNGKPDPAVFHCACDALGVEPTSAVMAGDDPWRDVDGARRAGLMSIRLRQGPLAAVFAGDTGPADATVRRLAEVLPQAIRLIQEGARHAD
jgi:putative hydrolase of the HAD superfamily